MKKYLLQLADGTIGETTFIPIDNCTIEDCIEKLHTGALKNNKVIYYREIPEEEKLPSMDFRDAWRLDKDKKLHIDIERAKKIHIERLQPKIKEHSAKLNKAFDAAFSVDDYDTVKRVSELKTELANIADTISSANITTIEQLSVYLPPVLQLDIEKDLKGRSEMKHTVEEANTQQIQQIMSDTSSALIAIKGFMMMMPELQKTLNEIKDSLNSGN